MAIIDDAPWFVAKDVCEFLAFLPHPRGGYSHHLTKLGPDDRRLTHRSDVGVTGKGGMIFIISESGLYKLIMRSDKPQAKEFQDWVTKVELPAIRKDGGYIAGEVQIEVRGEVHATL